MEFKYKNIQQLLVSTKKQSLDCLFAACTYLNATIIIWLGHIVVPNENITNNSLSEINYPNDQILKNINDPLKIIELINFRKKKYQLRFNFCEVFRGFIFCCKSCRSKSIMAKKSLYKKSNFIVDEYLKLKQSILIICPQQCKLGQLAIKPFVVSFEC